MQVSTITLFLFSILLTRGFSGEEKPAHFVEEESIVIPSPPASSEMKLQLYIESSAERACSRYHLTNAQCTAIVKFLFATYVPQGKSPSYLYYERIGLLSKTGRRQTLKPSLNISTVKEHKVTTPCDCVSKILLNPYGGDRYSNVTIPYTAWGHAISEVEKNRLCRHHGVTKNVCSTWKKFGHNFTNLNKTADKSDIEVRISIDRSFKRKLTIGDGTYITLVIGPMENLYHKVNHLCKARAFTNTVCSHIKEILSVPYAAWVRAQLLSCAGVLETTTTAADNGVTFLLRHVHISNGGLNPVLNLWNFALDESFYDAFDNCSIQYMKPEGGRPSIYNFSESTLKGFDYGSVIRHPSSGMYMLYYRATDPRRHNHVVWATVILESSDGESFRPLTTTVLAGLESNILLYDNVMTHNFSPFVDYSECVSAQALPDNPNLSPSAQTSKLAQWYLRSEKKKQNYCSLFQHSFKGIGSTHENSSKTRTNGILSLHSYDGLNWIETAPKKTLLSMHDAAEAANFNSVYYDTLSNLLFDFEEKRYKLFTRHNPMTGVRSVQMFTSTSECGWNDFEVPGRIVKFSGEKSHPLLSEYTPGATYIPGSKYIAFFSTALYAYVSLPTFLTFMYSTDGGRSMIHSTLSLSDPSRNPPMLNIDNTEATTANKVKYGEFGVSGMVESPDCQFYYIYAETSPSVVKLLKFRYGGIAAIETKGYKSMGKETHSRVVTKLIRLPIGTKMLVMNYETRKGGYVKVGIEPAAGQQCTGTLEWHATLQDFSVSRSCIYKGDELARLACWHSENDREEHHLQDISAFSNTMVKLVFEMKYARLYGFMFANSIESYAEKMRERGTFCMHEFTSRG